MYLFNKGEFYPNYLVTYLLRFEKYFIFILQQSIIIQFFDFITIILNFSHKNSAISRLRQAGRLWHQWNTMEYQAIAI